MKVKIYRCLDCGFLDKPPPGFYNLDKCPYCRNDDWKEIKKKKRKGLLEKNWK